MSTSTAAHRQVSPAQQGIDNAATAVTAGTATASARSGGAAGTAPVAPGSRPRLRIVRAPNIDRFPVPQSPVAPRSQTAVVRSPELDLQLRDFAVRTVPQILEAIDGRRPLSQLRAHLNVPVYNHLERRIRARPRPTPLQLHRVHVQAVSPHALEVAASYRSGGRVHALAARVERRPATSRHAAETRVVALILG